MWFKVVLLACYQLPTALGVFCRWWQPVCYPRGLRGLRHQDRSLAHGGVHVHSAGTSWRGSHWEQTVCCRRVRNESNQWILLSPRVQSSCLTVSVFLRYDGTSDLATIESYDPITNTWQPEVSMGTRRSCLGVAVLHGLLYAAGGYDGASCLNRYAQTNSFWLDAKLCAGAEVTNTRQTFGPISIISVRGCQRKQVNTCLCFLLKCRAIWPFDQYMGLHRRHEHSQEICASSYSGYEPETIMDMKMTFYFGPLPFKDNCRCFVAYVSSQRAACMLWAVTTAPHIWPRWRNTIPW